MIMFSCLLYTPFCWSLGGGLQLMVAVVQSLGEGMALTPMGGPGTVGGREKINKTAFLVIAGSVTMVATTLHKSNSYTSFLS